MTELKHTPGPWSNDEGLVNGRESRDRFKPSPSIDIYDADDWPEELEEEAQANARLIAEAPAMVELLKLAREQITDLDAVLNEPNHEVMGWNLNDTPEPVSSFFDDNDYGALEKINALLKRLEGK